MEGVESNAKVELVFATVLHHVLVAADAARLQGLAAQLLPLVADQVHAEGEIIHRRLLRAQVIDPDFGI